MTDIRMYHGAGTAAERLSPTFSGRMNATGLNFGNIFFYDALSRHVTDSTPAFTWESAAATEDILILSMANLLSPYVDMAHPSEILRTAKAKKIVMIGVGAQGYDYSENLSLPTPVVEFMQIVSHRSETIGVRGDYSAELLFRNGIRNVEVIGCPSLFHEGARFPTIRAPDMTAPMAVHATPSLHLVRSEMAHMLGIGMRADAHYVLQSEHDLGFLFDGGGDRSFRYFIDWAKPQDRTFNEFERWLRTRSVYFSNRDEWVSFLTSHGFVAGSRFHGNVASLMAGTPAVTVAIDTRTRELCELFHLPHIHARDVHQYSRMEDIAELADFSDFNANYSARYGSYLEFLRRNEIPNILDADTAMPQPNRTFDLSSLGLSEAVQARSIERCMREAGGISVAKVLARSVRSNARMAGMNSKDLNAAILKEPRPSPSKIPSMITWDEEKMLRVLARDYFKNEGIIVDAGIFTGRSSQLLAWALQSRSDADTIRDRGVKPIFSYDLAVCDPFMAGLINKQYGSNLQNGDSFLPFIEKNLAPLSEYIFMNPGDIRERSVIHNIEIAFIDVCKTAEVNHHVMQHFMTKVIPGHGVIIQQDFVHEWLPWIHVYTGIMGDRLELIGTYGSSALYKLVKPLHDLDFRIDLYTTLPVYELVRLIDVAASPLKDKQRYFTQFAKCRMLIDKGELDMARTLHKEISFRYEALTTDAEYAHAPKPAMILTYAAGAGRPL